MYNLPYAKANQLPTELRKNASVDSVLTALQDLATQIFEVSDAYRRDWSEGSPANWGENKAQMSHHGVMAREIREVIDRLEEAGVGKAIRRCAFCGQLMRKRELFQSADGKICCSEDCAIAAYQGDE